MTPPKYPFRVGITGHRENLDTTKVTAALDKALGMIDTLIKEELSKKDPKHTGYYLSGITSLAEGADRIFAEVVVTKYEGKLEVILPFKPVQNLYNTTNFNWNEFCTYLQKDPYPLIIDDSDKPHKEYCFTKAGRLVVDECDVMIAVWDGDPARGTGGTAEIREYALNRNKPLITISTVDWSLQFSNFNIELPDYTAFTTISQKMLGMSNKMEQSYKGLKITAEKAIWDELTFAALAKTYWDEHASTNQTSNKNSFKWIYRMAAFAATFGIIGLGLSVAELSKHHEGIPQHGVIEYTALGLHVAELVTLVIMLFYYRHSKKKTLHNKWVINRQLAEKVRIYIFKRACLKDLYEVYSSSTIVSRSKVLMVDRRIYLAIIKQDCRQQAQNIHIQNRLEILEHDMVSKQVEYHKNKRNLIKDNTEEHVERVNLRFLYSAMLILLLLVVIFFVPQCQLANEMKITLEVIKLLSLATLMGLPLYIAYKEGIRKIIDYDKVDSTSDNMKHKLTEIHDWLALEIKKAQQIPNVEYHIYTQYVIDTNLTQLFIKVEDLFLSENTDWGLLPKPVELKIG